MIDLTRNFYDKPLLEWELNLLSKRVDQIDEILELCDDDKDQDVIDNLIDELDTIKKFLNKSIKTLK